MSIFNKGFKEERDVADLFQKFKDNNMMFDHVFDKHDNNLINKCVNELDKNLNKNKKKNPEENKLKKYIHVLKITKERFSNYFHFYTFEELAILNQLIKKLESDLKQFQ